MMIAATRGAILRALACLALMAAPALPFAAPATAQSAQGIAVLVNDEPISSYDVEQRLRLLTVTTGQRDSARLRSRAIDELIDEKLMMQEARRLDIKVPQEQVQEQLRIMAQRSNLSLQQFTQALGSVGINLSSFSKRIEVQLAWPYVIRARFGGSVQVRQEDIDTALERLEGPKITTRYEFMLQGILFIVPEGASTATVNARRNLAEHLRRGFRSCAETKAQLAGVPDVVISDLGKRTSDTMAPADRERFDKLNVNETTAPRTEDRGIEIIAVCAKNEIKDEKLARRTAEMQLINQEFEVMARRHLHDLRRDAVIERR